MENKNTVMARRIASAVKDAGGHTYYVGGCVRDRLLERDSKDIDIEIHGIPVKTLESILDSLGKRLVMGESFGIMGLRGYDLDIAMPRSEIATGRGHKDFEVTVDPFLGEEKAARRRDFTINALMQDVISGQILDFFGGKKDLENHLIRHVDKHTFTEDPLRVFRAAQFAARFHFSIAQDTVILSSEADTQALSCERVMDELEKALMKSDTPSVFFEELRKMDQLSVWFPEIKALAGVPQNKRSHPEGDVWNHTMLVLDEAAVLRNEASHPFWFMLSALCHDLGKAVTTRIEDQEVYAYGHDSEGLSEVKRFISRLTREVKLIKYVLNMSALHMQPNRNVRDKAHEKAYMKMFDRSVCPEDLLLLAKADHIGRSGTDAAREDLLKEYAATCARLKEMLALYKERMEQPYLMGKDLMDAGIRPGPIMGEALAYAHKLRLAGISKEEQLRHTLSWIRKYE